MSDLQKDYTGSKFGMWLFLFTEVILFGGLFLLYAVYYHNYPDSFVKAGKELNVFFGGFNTLLLITSSFFMAISITAIQKGDKKKCLIFLSITIASACGFLIVKFFEWSAKFAHGIYPNSPHLLELPPGENIFYGLYFTMTGLHGVHVIIGGILLTYIWINVKKDQINAKDYILLENSGLYWHIVDLIWIYLFPLFYLIV